MPPKPAPAESEKVETKIPATTPPHDDVTDEEDDDGSQPQKQRKPQAAGQKPKAAKKKKAVSKKQLPLGAPSNDDDEDPWAAALHAQAAGMPHALKALSTLPGGAEIVAAAVPGSVTHAQVMKVAAAPEVIAGVIEFIRANAASPEQAAIALAAYVEAKEDRFSDSVGTAPAAGAAGAAKGFRGPSCDVHHRAAPADDRKGPVTPVSPLAVSQSEAELAKHAVPFDHIAKSLVKVAPSVPLPLRVLLKGYTGNWFYRELNAALRDGNAQQYPQTVALMNTAIALLPAAGLATSTTARDQAARLPPVLYRGQPDAFGVDYAVGSRHCIRSFWSTTTNRSVAVAFGAGAKVLFEIRGVSVEARAAVKALSCYPSEDEVLLRCGLHFVVDRFMANKQGHVTVGLRAVAGGDGGGRLLRRQATGPPSASDDASSSDKDAGGVGDAVAADPVMDVCPVCRVERILATQPFTDDDDTMLASTLVGLLVAGRVAVSAPAVISGGGESLLHLASRAGYWRVCRVLADFGADLLAPATPGGATALHAACEAGRDKSAETIMAAASRAAPRRA